MDMPTKNLRKWELEPGTGIDAKETQLKGVAKRTEAEKQENSTVQYTTPKMSPGPLGGQNTNS